MESAYPKYTIDLAKNEINTQSGSVAMFLWPWISVHILKVRSSNQDIRKNDGVVRMKVSTKKEGTEQVYPSKRVKS